MGSQSCHCQFQLKKKLKELTKELSKMLRAREWDQALALLDRLEEESSRSSELSKMRLSILQRAGRTEAVSKLRAELVEQSWDDGMTLP